VRLPGIHSCLSGTHLSLTSRWLILRWRRQELIAWLNNLLQLNITKVEQCGTGYVIPLVCPETARLAAALGRTYADEWVQSSALPSL